MSDQPSRFPDDLLVENLCEDAGYFLRGGRLLEAGRSRWQAYEVWETPRFGRLFRLDGCFMSSERDEFHYHENLVHVPGIAHPGPRSALIIGGGDGGSAEELLKYPGMARVVIVELDDKVVEISRRYLHQVHHGALDDPRVEIRIVDGLQYVYNDGPTAGARYDLIVLDLTDPGGPSLELYTPGFYRACASRLTPLGAMSLHIASPVAHPDRIRQTLVSLRSAFSIVTPYLTSVPLYGGMWMMACCSATLDPRKLSAPEIDRRIAQRGIAGLQYYNGEMHRAALAMPNFVRALVG